MTTSNTDLLIYLRDTDYHYEDQYYYESCNDEKKTYDPVGENQQRLGHVTTH